jgi:hypothetical protein
LEGYDVEKIWDNSLSLLVNSHPQAFVDLLLPGAMCLQNHRTKLSGTQRQPDAVLEVIRYDELFMFNPEFRSAYDLKWLEERFSHMDDDILIGSPVYRWIIERGHEEEKAQGLAQVRQAVVDFVRDDFPELVQLAEEVVATIDNSAQLVRLSTKLGGAQNADQARKILSALVQ